MLEPYRRRERRTETRASGSSRAATHAGGQRHLPRLAPSEGFDGKDPRLLRAPAVGLEGVGADVDPWSPSARIYGEMRVAGRWLGLMPDRATASRSRRIWVRAVFDRGDCAFADGYADQNERDHAGRLRRRRQDGAPRGRGEVDVASRGDGERSPRRRLGSPLLSEVALTAWSGPGRRGAHGPAREGRTPPTRRRSPPPGPVYRRREAGSGPRRSRRSGGS